VVVNFENDAHTATFTLTDAAGTTVAFDTDWSEGNVSASSRACSLRPPPTRSPSMSAT